MKYKCAICKSKETIRCGKCEKYFCVDHSKHYVDKQNEWLSWHFFLCESCAEELKDDLANDGLTEWLEEE